MNQERLPAEEVRMGPVPDSERSEPGPALPDLLVMRGITKDFPGGRVLFGVDFTLRAGEVHALVGQNGAGKSTLMKILAGVYPDHGGTITLDGTPLALREPREAIRAGIAVIYQDFTLIPELTVAENIALGREPGGPALVDHAAVRRESAREAAAIGIDLPMDVPVRRLGVAGQQLTEIVKAVSRHARILVMDEPTARLSGAEREHLFRTVRDLVASGVSIVYISHFLEEIFSVADRVTVLRDGRVVAERPTSVLDLPALARLVVGRELRRVAERRESHVRPGEVGLRLTGFGVPGRSGPFFLEVSRGEVLGLAGLVGSGRTSLARALVGLERSAVGTIALDGWEGRPRDPGQAAELGLVLLAEDRKRQGLVLQRPVAENVALTALRERLSRLGFVRLRRRDDIVRDLIARLAILPPQPEALAGRLSGGNQQKVVIGRAIAAEARVLILDQPTSGVDVGAKADIYQRIDELARDGATILFISDDLDELLRLCDRIVVMHRGRPEPPVEAGGIDRAALLEALSETTEPANPPARAPMSAVVSAVASTP
jgi:ABC-type sugar transport system ATPase subunit